MRCTRITRHELAVDGRGMRHRVEIARLQQHLQRTAGRHLQRLAIERYLQLSACAARRGDCLGLSSHGNPSLCKSRIIALREQCHLQRSVQTHMQAKRGITSTQPHGLPNLHTMRPYAPGCLRGIGAQAEMAFCRTRELDPAHTGGRRAACPTRPSRPPLAHQASGALV